MPSYSVDSASVAIAKGDVLVLIADSNGMQVVTKGVPSGLSAGGFALAIASEDQASGRVKGTQGPTVPASITGLAASPGLARVSATGRVERVSSYVDGDYPIGHINAQGTLYFMPAKVVGAPGAGSTGDTQLSARAAAPSNLSVSVAVSNVVDEIPIANQEDILLPNQTDPSQNGLYRATVVGASMTLARSPLFNTSALIRYGRTIHVAEGGQYEDSVWQLTTKVPITVGTTPLVFSRGCDVNDHTRVTTLYTIQGTPVLPGPDARAETRAVFDTGAQAFYQPDGLYLFDDTLAVTPDDTDLGIFCPNGQATIEANYVGVGADDPLNALIVVRGVLNTAKLNTTPTSVASGVNYYPAASQAFSVAAVGTLAAGDWVIYGGSNHESFGEYFGAAGSASNWEEILQVDSISSLTLRLKQHTLQHHTLTNGSGVTPITVKAVAPVVGFHVRGIKFSAPNGTIANGITYDYAAEATLEKCSFENFSRAAVEWRKGSRGLTMTDCTDDGGNNAFVLGWSGHLARIYNCRTNERGARYHAAGRIRGTFTMFDHCAEWTISNCDIAHVALPVWQQSSRNLTITDCRFRDTDVDEVIARDIAASDSYSHGEQAMGLAISQGAVDLTIADWSIGTAIVNVLVVDARSATTTTAGSVWLHDTRRMTVSNLQIKNMGRSHAATIDGQTKHMGGVRTQDIDAECDGIHVIGCQYSFYHVSSQGLVVRGLRMQSHASSGVVPVIGLYFAGNLASNPVFYDVTTDMGIYFDPAFVADWGMVISRLTFDEGTFDGAIQLVNNRTGSTLLSGYVAELDAANANGAVWTTTTTPTAGTSTPIINVMPGLNPVTNGSYFLAQIGGSGRAGYVHVGTAEFRPGQLLRAKGGGTFEAEANATPGEGRVGMVIQYKAAGAAGRVRAA